MGKILLKGALYKGSVQDILIDGNLISQIGVAIEAGAECKVIDCAGKGVIPGFVNMHTHAAMTLLRGYNEDTALMDWLQEIWKVEARMDEEMIYWGTKLACLEMIKTGTTAFNDQYWMIESSLKGIEEMGLRSLLSFVALDGKDEAKSEQIKEGFEKMWERAKDWPGLSKMAVGIHAPYTVSDSLMVWCSNFARERGLKVHIHVSETQQENIDSLKLNGCSPFEHLERLGILGPEVIAAHCVWLSERDMDIIAKYGVNVVHNINSNLKLASGERFLYNELRDRGVNICLGTDGCGSSNNLDMRESMKTTALLQKGWRRDATAMPLGELMNLATVNGAKAMGLNSGVVEVGHLADLVLVDIDNYAFTPNLNFLSNLVYSANSSCIDTVICDGRILMEGGVVPGEREILDSVKRVCKKLYN